jgi:hypothetical protein
MIFAMRARIVLTDAATVELCCPILVVQKQELSVAARKR